MTAETLTIADHQVIKAVCDDLAFEFCEPGGMDGDLRDLVKDCIPWDQIDDLRLDRAWFRAYLKKVATRILLTSRINTMQVLDRYAYRPVDVIRMLRGIGDHENWERTYVPADAKWIKGNDSMEVLADVLLAMPKVSMHNREVLFRTYWLWQEPEGPGEEKVVREAVIELTRKMNDG